MKNSTLLKGLLEASKDVKTITEVKAEYNDSGQFTDDMVTVEGYIENAKKILVGLRWKNWMTVTDQNFGTNCREQNKKMFDEFKKFEAAYRKLEDTIEDAA